ncbi:MAG: serine protease [Caulobacter segnis]|uniref:Serine protease n=2 Tax=Caulobacter segnis TaxID=88688 RepID=A0A2W5UZX9_9CAUL|nr:MAG: serine protease [Caulobacter segnis]
MGVLLALLCAVAAGAEPAPVRYALSPVIEQGALRALAVDIDFQADPSGRTTLRFVDGFEHETRPGRYAEGLEILGAEGVTPRPDGGAEIRSAPGARLHARYRIRSGYDAPPTTRDSDQTKPIVLADWFYVAGELVFAYPEGQHRSPATFNWKGGESGFRFASDLERLSDRDGVVDDILDSILMGSPRLRVTEGRGRYKDLRLAALGTFQHYDDAAFADMTFRVIDAERAFWGDGPSPFLVTLAPLKTSVGESYGGTGRSDAFALWVGETLPLADLRRLLAHEYFHTWNPAELGRPGKQRRDAWLSEGFTDFYARRLLLRAGLYTLADYAKAWNEDLLAYGVSPARNATEDQIAKGYWQDEALEEITYKRGALLAALFDAQLRRKGRGLDPVVRRMRALRNKDPESGLRANFAAAFAAAAGRPATPEIDRYALRGETLTLPGDTFACLTLGRVTQPIFALGFDLEATGATGVFSGVDPAGPAYAAGLRDGMKRLAREGGAMNDSSVEIAYRVVDTAGQERVIRFKPEGETSVTFQRLSVRETMTPSERKACARALGGG